MNYQEDERRPSGSESAAPASQKKVDARKVAERERRKARRAAWLSILSWGTVMASIGGFFTLWHQIGSTSSGTTAVSSSSSATSGYASSTPSTPSYGYQGGGGFASGSYGSYGSGQYGGRYGGYSSGYGGYGGSASISPGSGSDFQSRAS